jgi:hypothetical protein
MPTQNLIAYMLGKAFATLLTINFVALTVIVPVIVLAGGWSPFYVYVLMAQAGLLLLSLILFVPPVLAISNRTSLVGEIVGDFILIKSQFGKPGRWTSILNHINSYISFYHLVFPVIIYALIKHRNLKTIAFDPSEFGMPYKSDVCPGMITVALLQKQVKSELIGQDIIADHFVLLENRYFIKNEDSALYLKLLYSNQNLALAFGTDYNEVLCLAMEICKEDNYDLEPALAKRIIDASLKIV